MIHFLRLLLWPFSLLYGLVIIIRNYLYDWGVLKAKRFDFPIIVVGNLVAGGTGKSPLTEYLIRLLKDSYKIAVLSRGYGRKSRGFMYVEETDNAYIAGDEPLQFKSKYPEITVAVSEDRVVGVEKLKDQHQVILLDDAYQHRALTPSFSILLFEYSSLFKPRMLLPAGDFRDTFNQRKRANVIIISKCPVQLSEQERREAFVKIAPFANQSLLFSFLVYGKPYCITGYSNREGGLLQKKDDVLLICGIANPKPLVDYLRKKCNTVQLQSYSDHHNYTKLDIELIIRQFQLMPSSEKYIVTTEKDFQRLKVYFNDHSFSNLPIWVIPIEASFNDDEKKQLSSLIFKVVSEKY